MNAEMIKVPIAEPADVTGARAYQPLSAALLALLEANLAVRRQNLVYVIASDMIPADAHGILFVRPRDIEKFRSKPTTNQGETNEG